MRFLDSNIIAYAFYENENQINCQNIIREGGIIDTIVLIESFNIIEKERDREYATRAIKSILRANIKIIDVDLNLIFETMKRAEKYKQLKFIDLLHYTTAIMEDCESILSYDQDFDNLEIPRRTK